MNDFERRLRDSIKSVGEGYRPADPYAAKQEFFRRRRRRTVLAWAGGAATVGAAAAAAFIAFAILGPADAPVRKAAPVVTPGVSRREPTVEPIKVGETPDGISVGGGYAWAVDSESHALIRINPVDNSSESIGIGAKDPEDVLAAHGAVWVTDGSSIIRYDPVTDVHTRTEITGADEFDLAVGEQDDIWALDLGGDLHRLGAATGDLVNSSSVGENSVDVATSVDEVWLYDRGAGEVIEWDPALEEVTTRADVGVSAGSDDLVAGLRYAWFYRGDDGMLLQIDKASGDVERRIKLGGSFAGLSIDKGTLWAMVNGGNREGKLYQIDVDRAQKIAEPIRVANAPYDVAAGYGSVWVTNNDTGEVTRVSLGGSPTARLPNIVFYYSDGDDIWAYHSDSQTTQVTDTPEPELSPTISRDGQTLVFQRGDGSGSEVPRIIRLDLETNEETDLGPGMAPSHGSPMGRLAFTLPPGPGGEPSRIMIVYGDDTVETIDLPAELSSVSIERITWSLFDNVLYLQAAGEPPQIYAFDLGIRDPLPVVPGNAEPGIVLVSPTASDEPSVFTAIELCCGQSPDFEFTTAELGILVGDPATGPVGEWTPFDAVVALDDIFRSPPGFGLYAVPAGNLDFDEDRGWTTNDHRAWLVGDGDELWLVDDSSSGLKDRMPLAGVQGVAVNPLFLNE